MPRPHTGLTACHWFSHPGGPLVASHCGFRLHFPDDGNGTNLAVKCQVTSWTPVKCLFKSFAHFWMYYLFIIAI